MGRVISFMDDGRPIPYVGFWTGDASRKSAGDLARFAFAWPTAIKKGWSDPPFSPREKVAGTAG